MKRLIALVKGNLVIVVLCLLMLASLPTAWFFASRWNSGIRTAQQSQVDKDATALAASRVTYTIKPGLPGVPDIELPNVTPNDRLTDWFKAQQERLAAEGKAVVQMAQDLNSRGRTVLVEGIFPEPPPSERDIKAFEFVRTIIPTRDAANPSAYEKLLARVRAGPPADPKVLGQALRDSEQQARERFAAEHGANANMNRDDMDALRKELLGKRLGEYQRHANDIGMYATVQSLPVEDIPQKMPGQPPPVFRCFLWQFDYWTISEVLEALAAANVDDHGMPTRVDQSVVKRVIKVSPQPFAGFSRENEGSPLSEGPAATGDLVPIDPNESITGRLTSRANRMYDVRPVRVQLVASTERLPQLFDAISRNRFLTVLDCDLSKVDTFADLDVGYYYGNEGVIKVDLLIETIWLRSWLEPLMPMEVKTNLGIGEPLVEDEPPPPPKRDAAPPASKSKTKSKEKKPAGKRREVDIPPG